MQMCLLGVMLLLIETKRIIVIAKMEYIMVPAWCSRSACCINLNYHLNWIKGKLLLRHLFNYHENKIGTPASIHVPAGQICWILLSTKTRFSRRRAALWGGIRYLLINTQLNICCKCIHSYWKAFVLCFLSFVVTEAQGANNRVGGEIRSSKLPHRR